MVGHGAPPEGAPASALTTGHGVFHTEALHVVERFTRVDADTLEYRFTVEDPTTWTRPWTVAFPMVRTEGPIYEYACHEGNYGLVGILSGARSEEKAAEETERKKQR